MQINKENAVGNSREFKIDLRRFKQSIEQVQQFNKWINNLYDAGVDIIGSPASSILNETIELLRILTKDKYDNINWWCYETDFGTNDLTEITYSDGRVKKIDTIEKLYDFLVEGAENVETKEI